MGSAQGVAIWGCDRLSPALGQLGRQGWESPMVGRALEPGREGSEIQLWCFRGGSVWCLTWPMLLHSGCSGGPLVPGVRAPFLC